MRNTFKINFVIPLNIVFYTYRVDKDVSYWCNYMYQNKITRRDRIQIIIVRSYLAKAIVTFFMAYEENKTWLHI